MFDACKDHLWVSRWLSCKNICLPNGRCRFDPWIGKIPWRRKWQPTAVFLLGGSYGQRSHMYRLQYMWLQRIGHDWAHTHAYAWTLPACIVLASRTRHWEIPCWPRAGFGERLTRWVIHSFIHVSSKRLTWLEKVLFLGNALFPNLGHSSTKSQGQSHYSDQNFQELRVHKGFWQM